ncbi:hypothetical protein M3I54_04925 [Paraburkholderia sp. CNPSo 3274]|uniref:hypothetical protein n=1 Tax=Paraburkholderia sp. CNPSo 3274 TaxID=2940932 RepID=UPI0020B8F3A4|nr:hypothetical protein [Paraburkholderia sp. CNPSo 3274]MCP3706333.1 hypothetical protein [Paraburkholderia sp. CNPSo 3274]
MIESHGSAGDATAGQQTRHAALSRNWAWTHQGESYDWMDSAGPFPLEVLAE